MSDKHNPNSQNQKSDDGDKSYREQVKANDNPFVNPSQEKTKEAKASEPSELAEQPSSGKELDETAGDGEIKMLPASDDGEVKLLSAADEVPSKKEEDTAGEQLYMPLPKMRNMPNDLSFTFHMSDNNNEDVEPLLLSDWIAVADGLGSTGHAPHSVKESERDSLEKILSIVLKEYNPSREDAYWEYFNRIFEPCMKNETNTSALWASRIVMSRFLFFIVGTENAKYDYSLDQNRNLLTNFIKEGLDWTANKLDFTVENINHSILPTTFAALNYVPNQDGTYRVDAIWAGDSRCYLLDTEGLRRLTKDDEDECKQINNLFSVEDSTSLNFKRYILKPPFVLISASDGFFDRYKTNFELEAKLLNHIQDSTSPDDLKLRLLAHYTRDHSDDTSVAFVPIGYNSFDDMKNGLAERTRVVGTMYEQFPKYKEALEVVDLPEKRVTIVVTSNIRDNFAKFIKIIVGAHYDKTPDILLTQSLEEEIKKCEQGIREDFVSNLAAKKNAISNRILEHLKNNPVTVAEGKAFKEKFENIGEQDAAIISKVVEAAKALKLCQDEVSKRKSNDEKLTKLYLKIADMQRALIIQKTDPNSNLDKNLKLSLERDIIKLCDLTCYLFDSPFSNNMQYSKNLNGIISEVKKYRANAPIGLHFKRSSLDQQKNTAVERYNRAIDSLKSLFGSRGTFLKNRKFIFTDELISIFELDGISETISEDEIRKEVLQNLVEKFVNDTTKIEEAIIAYAANPESTSLADGLFAPKKLSTFRVYYRYKTDNEFQQYKADLLAFEEKADSLI